MNWSKTIASPVRAKQDCGSRDEDYPSNGHQQPGTSNSPPLLRRSGRSFTNAVRRPRVRDHLYGREKAISPLSDSLDESRLVSRVTQGIPDLPDGNVDALFVVHIGFAVPHDLAQLVTRNQALGMIEQAQEEQKRFFLQADS